MLWRSISIPYSRQPIPIRLTQRRLRDDYAPTGFQGYGVQGRAVRGHEFGLRLSAEEKKALIAFLKTL